MHEFWISRDAYGEEDCELIILWNVEPVDRGGYFGRPGYRFVSKIPVAHFVKAPLKYGTVMKIKGLAVRR